MTLTQNCLIFLCLKTVHLVFVQKCKINSRTGSLNVNYCLNVQNTQYCAILDKQKEVQSPKQWSFKRIFALAEKRKVVIEVRSTFPSMSTKQDTFNFIWSKLRTTVYYVMQIRFQINGITKKEICVKLVVRI